MADTIYLKTGQFSASSFKTSKNDLKRAADALNTLDYYGAMVNAMYTCNGYRHRIFTAAMAEEASSLAILIERLHGKLEAYSKLLQSGPEAIRDVDLSFKGEYTNAWQRGWYAISSGVSSVYETTVIFWGSLFRNGGRKTGAKTEIAIDQETDQTPVIQKEKTQNELYREAVEKANNGVPVGEPQDSHEHGSWMCTWASTATILRRKQAVDGNNPTFSRDGVYSTNPAMVYSTDYTDEYGHTYHTASEDSGTMNQRMAEKQIDSKTEYIRTVLDEHPEGIVVYSNYPYKDKNGEWHTGQHAIVVTDYEVREDGSIQFYADDPVNDRDGNLGRTEIENTWMYKVNNNIIEECFRIWYVS